MGHTQKFRHGAENTYTKGKEHHNNKQLKEHYDRNAQTSIDIVEYVHDEYKVARHYLPHGVGLATLAVVGGMLISSYNQANQDYFDTAYFSSW